MFVKTPLKVCSNSDSETLFFISNSYLFVSTENPQIQQRSFLSVKIYKINV